MKKFAALLVLLSVCMFSVVGCGDKKTDPKKEEVKKEEGKTETPPVTEPKEDGDTE